MCETRPVMFETESGGFLHRIRKVPELEGIFGHPHSSRIYSGIFLLNVGQSQSLRDKCGLASIFTGRLIRDSKWFQSTESQSLRDESQSLWNPTNS